MLHNLYISKESIENFDDFASLVGLHNCIIVNENEFYYIIDGDSYDLFLFYTDWSNLEVDRLEESIFYDLYLYVIPKNQKLVKIPHLTFEDGMKYANQWIDMNDLHEYMLVTEDSTPWVEPTPDICIETPNWIISEYDKLQGM